MPKPKSFLTDDALVEAIKLGATNYLAKRKAKAKVEWQRRNQAVLLAGKTPGDFDVMQAGQDNLEAGIAEIKGMKL